MSNYNNFGSELYTALYGEAGVEGTSPSDFTQSITPLMEKHFPAAPAPVAAAPAPDQNALLALFTAALGQKSNGKQRKRQGTVTMPKPTIAQKEIFSHAAFLAGVEAKTIEPEDIRYKDDHKSKAGQAIPVGWTHFVKHIHEDWATIKDLPDVDAALATRQAQYKTWRDAHPNAKSGKNGSLYDQFVADSTTPAFVVPQAARDALASRPTALLVGSN